MQICHYGPGQLKALSDLADIVRVKAQRKFTVVHADNLEAVCMVLGIPTLQYSKIANTVDAGILPKINEQHMPTVSLDGVRNLAASVDPLRVRREVRRLIRERRGTDCQDNYKTTKRIATATFLVYIKGATSTRV